MPPLVTLTTDYGTTSPYVAALKGVLLAINPGATILDLTHDIPPQNIAHVSYFLAGSLHYYPPGSLHVVVVDPGVGTSRALLYVRAGEQQILTPDNGCWTAAAANLGPLTVRRLTETRFWRKQIANTFHGRDILAPVAGYLSLGITPESLGPVVTEWLSFTPPAARVEPGRISGEVVFVDTYGNLQTNISGDAFRSIASPRITVPGAPTPRVVRTYGDTDPGTLVAIIASSNRVEIAVAQGNAARTLNCGVGTPVLVEAGG